ncbi:unnamed protein product [Allacma fusca]|uniref:Peptidase M12B domain-containing protein n=1 Tax=Allacma fusca TaxID=39272 RepID=A0A8J2K408_9HEXA|nr:unnamed protein product [Allacma fusca]
MDEIENSIYVDTNANAFLKIRDVNGDFELHGIVDNFHISHDGERHFAVSHIPTQPITANDYKHIVETHNSTRITRESGQNPRGLPNIVEPELLIFVDYAIFNNAMGRSNSKLTDYLQILVRAVNNRYAVTPDPIIRFKIVGAVALCERHDQLFIEENKINGNTNAFDISNALYKFSDYMYKYRDNYTKHDIATLLSGEDFRGVAGLAWIGGACNEGHCWKSSRKTQISQDQNGFWRGTYTFAHELAHNLNVDGDNSIGDNASQCPWSEGYIMSYQGWGKPNKFRFSSCTMKQIAEFLRSDKSACLKIDDSSSSWVPASQDPGERMLKLIQGNLQMNFARKYHRCQNGKCLES